jgi:hypothetical protein
VTYDQFGEPEYEEPPVDADAEPEADASHECDKGWLDRNADVMVPCPRCKPELAAGHRVHLH